MRVDEAAAATPHHMRGFEARLRALFDDAPREDPVRTALLRMVAALSSAPARALAEAGRPHWIVHQPPPLSPPPTGVANTVSRR